MLVATLSACRSLLCQWPGEAAGLLADGCHFTGWLPAGRSNTALRVINRLSAMTQGLYSLRRRCLISIGIPIINLRWSSDRLRFIMGIPIPVRRCLLSE